MVFVDYKKVYANPPPAFGHALKEYFAMDPEYLNLNNGSYGTTPKPVLQAVEQLNAKAEENPDRFHRMLYQPLLQNVRQQLADLIKADVDEVVLVTNASVGLNTVLRNFHWEKGDIIFAFSTTYGSIARTVKGLADVPPHPTLFTIPLNFPTTKSAILAAVKEAFAANPVPSNKKRVAVIDGIISNPGVLLPWKEIVDICKDNNVWSVVDAAHSIGQEVELDLTSSAPDFWISNCHKWLSAKRSCAVLYVPKRNQHIIQTSIPTSHTYISPEDRHGRPNFVEQFEWNGTIDWGSNLTITDALEFRSWLGGEKKINAYCHDLAMKGGKVLAKTLDTREMDPEGEFTLNMVNVELPLPPSLPYSTELDLLIKDKMLLKYKAYSAHFPHNGAWWTRCSAQVWNTVEDFEKLGKIWLKVCEEVKAEYGLNDQTTNKPAQPRL